MNNPIWYGQVNWFGVTLLCIMCTIIVYVLWNEKQ